MAFRLPTAREIWDGTIGGLSTHVDDAVKDIGTGLSDAASELIDNTVFRVDDILIDTFRAIKDIPKALLDDLMKMFRDQKFWQGVLLWLGLTMLAEGLVWAELAPAGAKGAAFLEGAGIHYQWFNMPFIVKLHRLEYLVSPKYRESVQKVLAPVAERMGKAGLDIGYATNLLRASLGVAESFGAILGKDWELTQSSWAERLSELGEISSDTLTRWSENPELMIEWIDENVILPEYSAAAGVMNRISAGLSTALERTDLMVTNLESLSRGLVRVAENYDGLFGTGYAELFKARAISLDELIFSQWELTRGMVEGVAEILESRISDGEIVRGFMLRENIVSQVVHNKSEHAGYTAHVRRLVTLDKERRA